MSAFTTGAPAAAPAGGAPAPTAAAATPAGVGFGGLSAPAPAPAPAAPAFGNSTTTTPGFGTTTTTGASAATTTGGGGGPFSTGVPAAATGGFSSSTTTTAVPPPASTTNPAASAATTAAGGGGGFFNSNFATSTTTTAPATTSTNNTPAPSSTTAAVLAVPRYDQAFPARSIWGKMNHLVLQVISTYDDDDNDDEHEDFSSVNALSRKENALLAGQELLELLRGGGGATSGSTMAQQLLLLQKHQPLERMEPNQNLRQQLQRNPTVSLSIPTEQPAGGVDGTMPQYQPRDGTLAPAMLKDVLEIADDLQIPEELALSLYQEASSSSKPFHSQFVHWCLQNWTEPNEKNAQMIDLLRQQVSEATETTTTTVAWAAREMYIAQRALPLRTLLLLLQHRVQESNDTQTSTNNNNNVICQATDALLQAGLVPNLIRIVREYTHQIEELRSKASQNQPSAASASAGNDAAVHEQTRFFWRYEVALQSCWEERQMAVECLFFVAYQVQMNIDEVKQLIELLRDLSNMLPVLNPYTDVPDPYERVEDPNAPTMQLWQQQQHQQHNPTDKDPLEWKIELATSAWKTGLPQLLKSCSTLVLASISALGRETVLMDRTTHRPNTFGKGNALLPPFTASLEQLVPIHNLLNSDTTGDWVRKDLLGLLMAAYSMLLGASPSALSSPRAAGASPAASFAGGGRNIDVRKTRRECMQSPARLKSFSFARICLIPAVKTLSDSSRRRDYEKIATYAPCDVSEFLHSVLAEFASQYLEVLNTSGDRPITRAKWEQDADDDLGLRRATQEQQRNFQGQFRGWSDASSASAGLETIPAAVNLLERPDCMEDLIAFAAAVCSLGPEYAFFFWSVRREQETAEVADLVPSRALRDLERQQYDDDLLRPSYFSLLAALSLASNPYGGKDGAAVVHALLTTEEWNSKRTRWRDLVEILRWYVRELDPQNYTTSQGSASSRSSGSSGPTSSTAYYYFDKGADPSTFGSHEGSMSDAATHSKFQELGDENTYILLSNLALIQNVCDHSPVARFEISSTNLPILGRDGSEVVGQDSTLTVLFTLAGRPLAPDVRGAVFDTIASLISVDGLGDHETAEMRQIARKGWDHLEAFQILPISILEQCKSLTESDANSVTGLSFPPSSKTLAYDRPKKPETRFPSETRYSIVYEMELVESASGHYPSTEGFLRLLASLFKVGGCPEGLGSEWRRRPGCSPYIEYVTDFVLPRATGKFEGLPALPFRSGDSQHRLLFLAMNVIDTVLSVYYVPDKEMLRDDNISAEKVAMSIHRKAREEAVQALGHSDIASSVTKPPLADFVKAAKHDFSSFPSKPAGNSGTPFPSDPVRESRSPVPSAKTPGFTILASMLSHKRGYLFKSVVSTLIGRTAAPVDERTAAVSYALYVSTPPTFYSAKEGVNRTTSQQQALLQGLRPEMGPGFGGSYWEAQAKLAALRLFCATLAREKALHGILQATTSRTSVVPVLRFQTGTVAQTMMQVDFALSQLLIANDAETSILSSLLGLIGFFSQNESLDIDIAAAAATVVFSIDRSLPPQNSVELLDNRALKRRKSALSYVLTKRFCGAASSPVSRPMVYLLQFVLERLLGDLRAENLSGVTLAVFGLKLSQQNNAGTLIFVDAILQLLGSIDFVLAPESAYVASSCYELVYHLTRIKSGNSDIGFALSAAEHVRRTGFWLSHLQNILRANVSSSMAQRGFSFHSYHAAAWLLKGIASDLHLLAGFSVGATGSAAVDGLLAPRPSQYKSLCHSVFSENGLLTQALRAIPMERPIATDATVIPSDTNAISKAKKMLIGNPNVVSGYFSVQGEKLLQILRSTGRQNEEKGIISWVEHWNDSVMRDCAASHLSDAIRLAVNAFVCTSLIHDSQITSMSALRDVVLLQVMQRMAPPIVADMTMARPSYDAVFYTTACRNLARATFSLASQIHGISGDGPADGIISVDAAAACDLMIRVIASSGPVGPLEPDGSPSRKHQRIASLATSLVNLMRGNSEQLPIDGDQRDLFPAAAVLAKLSAIVPRSQVPSIPSAETLAARSCLTFLLRALRNPDVSGCRDVFMQDSSGMSGLKSLVDLIPLLDPDIAVFLQGITQFTDIPDLLVDTDLLKALHDAANTYQNEEASVLENLPGVTVTQAPPFLLGHIELLSSLMVSQLQDNRRKQDVAQQTLSILRNYGKVLGRLLERFPADGNILRAFLQCMHQAKALLKPEDTSFDNNILILSSSQGEFPSNVLSSPQFCYKTAALVLHIAEHPLPRRFLGKLPSRFEMHQTKQMSGVVNASIEKKDPWWDNESVNSSISETHLGLSAGQFLPVDICEYSRYAMDIVSDGLSLILDSGNEISMDLITLARSLHQCADATIRVESSLRGERNSGHGEAEREDVLALHSKLSAVLTQLLTLIILRIRAQKRNSSGIASDLVDTINLCCRVTDGVEGDENSRNFLVDLSNTLKKELETPTLLLPGVTNL